MRMQDWDAAGIEPLFGHQREWLNDELARMEASEVAAFAVEEKRQGVAGRRLLIATELGLIDAWHRPDPPDDPRLTATFIPWPEVGDVRLHSETGLDAALRHATHYRLTLGQPALDGECSDPDALVAFWRECLLRAGQPPAEKPGQPE